MVNTKHRFYNLSAILIFISAGFGMINFFILRDELILTQEKVTAIFTIIVLVGLGFLVRQGYNWIKWLLLVIMIIGLIGLPAILTNFTLRPIIGLINILQTFLQIGALVLVFMIKERK